MALQELGESVRGDEPICAWEKGMFEKIGSLHLEDDMEIEGCYLW